LVQIVDLASLGSRGVKILGNEDYKQLAWRITGAGDVNQDGIGDFVMSALYTNDGEESGGAYVIFGKAGGLGTIDIDDLDPAQGFFVQGPADGHLIGDVLTPAGDFNGDGFDDWLIGSPRDSNYAGRSYLVFGRAAGLGTLDLATLAATDGFAITNNVPQDWAGSGLSSAGDINHDGYDDIIVGNVTNRAYVIFGKASGFDTIELNAFDPSDGFIIEGDGANDMAGAGATDVGDFNGDGIDDFAIGAVIANKAYIIFGKEAAWTDLDLGDLAAADGLVISQGSSTDTFGYDLASAGDINGDGFEDLLVGTNNGRAYLIFGRASGSPALELSSLGSAGFLIQGGDFDSFGSAVGSAGDVNGDGFDDMLIGALGDSRGGHYAGGAYVVYGKASGFSTIDVATMSDAEGYFIQGEGKDAFVGARLKESADVNGDGFSDVLLGTARNSEGGLYAGAAYVVYGTVPTADVVRVGTVAGQILAGGTGNDMLDGREGDDELYGNGGNDLLDGGLGADEMRGGLGNDTYVVDDAGDKVVENAGAGTDAVRTGLAVYSLAALANVENIIGISATGQTLTGNSAGNRIAGGAGNDNIHLWVGGGNDTALGNAGNDNFFFGSKLTVADTVRGGAGVDTIVIQGNYNLTLTNLVTEIENISLLAGSNVNFGEPGTNLYDYVLTTHDSNFAAGVQARINGSALLAGEDFTFNGSAETNASFVVYGGKGKDTLTGGLGNDIFFYAEERFASGDTVNGGAGYDGMFLRGNYTIDFNAPGYTGLFTNIENLTLTSATDERYARGGGAEFDYNLVLSDAIVGAGQALTISGALLMASETMILDASLESNGTLRLFGGQAADTLKGGALADLLHGNLGADTLSGGGGADAFRYQDVAESNSASTDQILDFTPGTDRIELDRIDANSFAAGNQAFTWIGSSAFGATGAASAGQLRAYQSGGTWFVEGDVNGDGAADLVIALTLQGPTPLGAGDFIL
jgi:FG-GAP-like repeat/RTX calcium-binding nonapeptide repeat (4 copies)/FG-GAP repeat